MLLLSSAGHAAPPRTGPCWPAHSVTLRANRLARVYQAPDPFYNGTRRKHQLFGCAYAAVGSIALDEPSVGDLAFLGEAIFLRGTEVLSAYDICSDPNESCMSVVQLRDLASQDLIGVGGGASPRGYPRRLVKVGSARLTRDRVAA